MWIDRILKLRANEPVVEGSNKTNRNGAIWTSNPKGFWLRNLVHIVLSYGHDANIEVGIIKSNLKKLGDGIRSGNDTRWNRCSPPSRSTLSED